MESCMAGEPSRVGPVEVNDIRRDLSHDFSPIPMATQGCVELEKENLRVYLRIRPFTSSESDDGESQDCVTIEGSDTAVLKAPRYSLSSRVSERPQTHTAQRFTFTQVYGQETSQRQMFEGTVRRLVREVLEGGNSLVFTYGVTNAGKTFTFLGPESDGGLLPRSLAVIFNSIEGRVYSQNNLKPNRCQHFTKLTNQQQEEENTSKRNLLRLIKESDCQRSTSSQSATGRSTFLEGSSLSSDSSVNSGSEGDSFSLDVDSVTKFSVWVSFCEIYNENIHDLLEQLPGGTHRRTVLRLSQDIKGNSFVKDLRWVQVNSSEEAYKIMKIGKKNQSFSATRLNQLSSRSHSIFSIRILRIEDAGVPRLPRVHTISELSLCDLAGSERCAKTQNRGDRLKEAGNINTSLLTLGKCMNALRLNQHAKFKQHVPFRESKLTHYLQGFFCGRGKACMIVNISQCASMYDETLNVLKFSALAQKVVVVNPKPVLPRVSSQRSAMDVSMILNAADHSQWGRGRKSSLVAWETSLEDVQEDDDCEEQDDDNDEEEEEGSEEEDSMMEGTVLEAGETTEMEEDVEQKSVREAEERLALETRIREEVTSEVMELVTQMKNDYDERLAKEREIIEERAEERLELLKNLVGSLRGSGSDQDAENRDPKTEEVLEGIITTVRDDLLRIRKDAEAAQNCLTELPEETHTQSTAELRERTTQMEKLSEQLLTSQQHTQTLSNELEAMRLAKQQSHDELEAMRLAKQRSHDELEAMRLAKQWSHDELEAMQLTKHQSYDQLEETKRSLEQQRGKFSELLEMCQQKEEMISKLETAMDSTVENATRDRDLVEGIKQELLDLRQNCHCLSKAEERTEKEGGRKRGADALGRSSGERATKRMLLEEEMWRLMEEIDKKEQTISQLRVVEEEKRRLGEELRRREEEVEELRKEHTLLGQTVETLTADLEEQSTDYDSLLLSLEAKQKETARLTKENQALVNGIFQLQSTTQTQGTEVTSLQSQLREHTDRSKSLSEQLDATAARLQSLESESEAKTMTIENLNQEVDGLTQEVKVSSEEVKRSSTFRATIEELQKESLGALERSAQKSQQMEELQSQVTQLEVQLSQSESVCNQLKEELASHKEASVNQLQQWQTEMGLLMQQAEGLQAQLRAYEASSARGTALVKQLAESEAQCAALRQRLGGMDGAEEERKREDVKEKEELRLALSQQEGNRREQEKLLGDRITQMEILTQELASLKDNDLQRRSREERRSMEEEKRVTLVEELKAEIQKLQERKEREGREKEEEKRGREFESESVKSEIERLQELNSEKEEQVRELQEQLSMHTTEVLDMSEGRFPLPEVEIQFSSLQPNTLNLRRQGDTDSVTLKITSGRTNRKKRKSTEMEDPVQSENKRNRLRRNSRAISQTPSVESTPVSVKGKKDGTLQKLGALIHSSPSILGSKAKTIMGLVSGHSVEKELLVVVKPRRTKRKLYKKDISSPMLHMSPQPMIEDEEKESDHLIIKRQLRSKTSRK